MDETKLSCLVVCVSVVWTQIGDRNRKDKFCLVFTQFQICNCSGFLKIWKLETGLRQNSWKLGRDKIKLSCLVCSSVHTADANKTRKQQVAKTVLSCLDPVSNLQLFSLKYIEDYWKLKLGRDKTKLSCLCQRCEQAITKLTTCRLVFNVQHSGDSICINYSQLQCTLY